jgi:hypothetical protein
MRWHHVLVCLGLLALLAGPTVALAQGGGSAGDQQYTDPFGSTTHSSTTQTQTQPQQTTTTAPVTTPPATNTTPATVTSSADAGSTADATAAASNGKTLPYTGLDLWTVVGVGLTLMASGLLIRVRSRRA